MPDPCPGPPSSSKRTRSSRHRTPHGSPAKASPMPRRRSSTSCWPPASDLVKRQKNLGISLPNDGEYGHAMAADFDYGAWWHYSFARTGGLELHDRNIFEEPANRSTPGNIVLTSFSDRRDRNLFPNVYADANAGADTGAQPQFPKATGPISYIGQKAVAQDIANLKAGLAAAGYDEHDGYINALSPGSASRVANEYYKTDEEFIWAWADVLREEYLAITEAGLTVRSEERRVGKE